MEPLINYRLLSDQLTQAEFISFIQQSITKLNAGSTIIRALYDYFKQSPDEIKPFMNIITNIIRNRREPDLSIYPAQRSISKLPASMISLCGSYLRMEDYFKFGQSCRKIYISLQQQPRLTECRIISKTKLPPFLPSFYPFKIFKNSKTLSID